MSLFVFSCIDERYDSFVYKGIKIYFKLFGDGVYFISCK